MPKGSENSEPVPSQLFEFEADFTCEAWQNAPKGSETAEPAWLVEARNLDAVRPYPDARDGALQILTPFGKPKVEVGDWIVRLPSGRLVIWPDAEFGDCFIQDGE